jgi:ABC-type lipoprotein export system ATPase subunit
MGELLRTTGLHRQFRMGDTVVRAVDGIDLSVGEGEFVSIMGPSGCGKSTLLYLLGGLDRPTGGEIHLSGRRVDRLSRTRWARLRRRQIGFVFQTFNLVENLTVLQNVQLLGLLRRFHAGGQTVVVVTHDPRVATTAGQRLLAMRDGRVVDNVRLDGGTGATRALRDLIET